MRPPALRFRLLLALFATLQVAAPPAASLADAAFARGAQWLGLHIEDQGAGRRDHPPHRDDCFFCQFLGQRAIVPRPAQRAQVAVFVSIFAAADPETPGGDLSPHLPDSRAPPLA